MVATRHSLNAQEKLLSLDSVVKPSTRSPSPRKRKLELETPEQRFVDARATPFTQRRKREGQHSPGLSEVDRSDSEHEIATDKLFSEPQSITTAASNGSKNPQSSSEVMSDSDDDAAPEVVSNVTGAADARARQAAQEDFMRRQQMETREKRRARDERLRLQREQHRQSLKSTSTLVDDKSVATSELQPSEIDISPVRHERPIIPRLLPEEILNAPQETSIVSRSDDVAQQSPIVGRHEHFELKKERTTTKKGDVTVQVLQRLRKDLAPKKVSSVANLKKQWLTSRGQHAKDRRSVRKPLI